MLPPFLHSNYTILLYLLLAYILIMGMTHFVVKRFAPQKLSQLIERSLVPLGACGAVFGAIGYIDNNRIAMETISMAGDISPDLVAGGLRMGFPIASLGLLCLAASFLFKYINQ